MSQWGGASERVSEPDSITGNEAEVNAPQSELSGGPAQISDARDEATKETNGDAGSGQNLNNIPIRSVSATASSVAEETGTNAAAASASEPSFQQELDDLIQEFHHIDDFIPADVVPHTVAPDFPPESDDGLQTPLGSGNDGNTAGPARATQSEHPRRGQSGDLRGQAAVADNNQPRFELFISAPGERKVRESPDTRIPNSSIFHFTKEDHTLGNLIRSQVLKNKHVLFSGYKVAHPLIPDFELRVQTDGSLTPREAVVKACEESVQDFAILSREFTKEWELAKMVGGRNGGGRREGQ